MKRTGSAIILMLVSLTLTSAQESSGITVFASSGVVVPSSPMAFANYWKMQYGGGLGAGYALTPSVTLVGSFEYYRFKIDTDGIHDGFDTQYMRDIWIFTDVSLNPSAAASSVMTFSVNLRVTPSGVSRFISPYGIAGAGVMRFSLADIAVPTTSTLTIDGTAIPITAERTIIGGNETVFFGQMGIGVDCALSALITPYVEARYVLGFTKGSKTSYIPLGAGVRVAF